MRRMHERIEDAHRALAGLDEDRTRLDQFVVCRIQSGGFEIEKAKRTCLDQHLREVGIQAEGRQVDPEFELIGRLQRQFFLKGRQARGAKHGV